MTGRPADGWISGPGASRQRRARVGAGRGRRRPVGVDRPDRRGHPRGRPGRRPQRSVGLPACACAADRSTPAGRRGPDRRRPPRRTPSPSQAGRGPGPERAARGQGPGSVRGARGGADRLAVGPVGCRSRTTSPPPSLSCSGSCTTAGRWRNARPDRRSPLSMP
jgi:hypothetical protein